MEKTATTKPEVIRVSRDIVIFAWLERGEKDTDGDFFCIRQLNSSDAGLKDKMFRFTPEEAMKLANVIRQVLA